MSTVAFLLLFWEGHVGDLSGSRCFTSLRTFVFLSAQCHSIRFLSARCQNPTIWFRSGQDGWISFASQSRSQFSKLCFRSIWGWDCLTVLCLNSVGMASCWLHPPKPPLMKCRRLGGSGQRYQATRLPVRWRVQYGLETHEMDSVIAITWDSYENIECGGVRQVATMATRVAMTVDQFQVAWTCGKGSFHWSPCITCVVRTW